MSSDPISMEQGSDQVSEDYENQHVHLIYDQIAPHFSQTRHKPWPIVSRFLLSLPAGAVGLDIGCGNGKCLSVNPNIFILGSDRSQKLIGIAKQHEPSDVVVADTLALPHQQDRWARMDFVVCIAVVHHLSTKGRRREALGEAVGCLRKEGRALIYVWALEQRGSRRGWGEGDEQDIMVPWIMKTGKKEEENGRGGEGEKTFQRYYHLYREGELKEDVMAAGGEVVESGYEKDNWWAICKRANEGDG